MLYSGKYLLRLLMLCFACRGCHCLVASCNTKLSDLKHSITNVICPANCLKQRSDLCGSDDYASGPLCLAAIHAGLIDNSGGFFEVYKSDAKSSYFGTTRNGVKSKSCTSRSAAYSFAMTCTTKGESENSIAEVFCPPGCTSNYVCGTGLYSQNSSVCAAAIHNGVLTQNGGLVTLYTKNGARSFVGTAKHGVTSKSCTTENRPFSFEEETVCTMNCTNQAQCLLGANQQYCSCKAGTFGKFCEKLASSCKELLANSTRTLPNGIYTLRDSNGNLYDTYCDMTIDGGGWTLIASVHENNPNNTGRCSRGDKWSSELGPGVEASAAAWMDKTTFGNVQSATSADFKNPGYFEIVAKNLMIWQIPQNTSTKSWQELAYLKYRTTSNCLGNYSGNLFSLYNNSYPIVSNRYPFGSSNGPAVPVVFDKGSASQLLNHFGPAPKVNVQAGYIQFRAVNGERSAYAMCPGLKLNQGFAHLEHVCLGSTGVNLDPRYCGDFAGWTYNGYGTHTSWSVDKTLIQSVFLLFYR